MFLIYGDGKTLSTVLEQLKHGHQLQQRGDLSSAEKIYRTVLDAEPENIHALNLVAAICVNSNRFKDAVKFIEKALGIRSNDPQALVNYALGLKGLGRAGEALKAARQSLELNPGNPLALNVTGSLLLDDKKAEEAATYFKKAVELDSGYFEAWSNLSSALKKVRNFQAAMAAAERALKLNPSSSKAEINIAEIYVEQGRFDKAATHYKRALSLQPDDISLMIKLAHSYREIEKSVEAMALFTRVIELDKNNADAYEAIGLLKEQMGDLQSAEELLLKSIQIKPNNATAHYQLAQLKGRQSTQEEVAAMESVLAQGSLKNKDKRYLLFGLAHASDQLEDREKAFAMWSAANAIKAVSNPYDKEGRENYYRTLLTEIPKAMGCMIPEDQMDRRPVFVVGMPRSGNTLTGQILASHPDVCNLGEVSYGYDVAQSVYELTGVHYPEGLEKLSGQQLAFLGEEYLRRYPDPERDKLRLVDNTPLNFQHVGLLATILPGARFINCVRNPVDTCFSIYKLPFGGEQSYSHSLEALAHQYNEYCQLLSEWKRLFPKRILDVCYEDTVADLEGQCRRVLEFLDLPYDDAVLEFHHSKRMIRTPSASQVRQPIYKDSVMAWKKYERYLGPLIENLKF